MYSDYASRLTGQPMFAFMDRIKRAEAAGKDIIHLEIGDPDFNTPREIVNSAIHHLIAGQTHYSSAQGNMGLRMDIWREYELHNRLFSPENVVIAPGCNPLIYAIASILCNPGDEVLICDPCFSTYESVFNLLNIKINRYPLKQENNYQIMEDFVEYITPNTKLIVLNSPNNPTGSILNDESLLRAHDNSVFKNCMLLSDEIYSSIDYDKTFASILDVVKDPDYLKNVIVLNGFSKIFAMSGWRIGFMIANPELCRLVSKWIETTVSCTNTFVQLAAREFNNSYASVDKMVLELKDRRDYLYEAIKENPLLSCNKPDGAFYFWVNITKTGLTSKEFCEKMFLAGVGLLPGTDFGPGNEGYVRIAYCQPLPKLQEAMRRITNAL